MKDRTNEAKWYDSSLRWQINVQRDGKRRTFTSSKKNSQPTNSKGKIEAEKKADKWLSEGKNKDVRLQQAWDDFIVEMKRLYGKSNWRQHEQMGRLWILPDLKHKRLSTITNQDWQDCVTTAYEKGKSKKTLKNIRASETRFYRYAIKNNRQIAKPSDIVIPKDAPVKEKKILQPDQLRILFNSDTIQHYKKDKKCWFIYAWRFEVLTGLRPGEIAGIKSSKDIREQILSIRRSINQYLEQTGGKNENAKREMLLFRQAAEVLELQRRLLVERGVESPWAFPDADGGAMDTKKSYKTWLTYRKQHGISSSLYELRHTMISISKSDMPEQLLKRIVGHSKSMDTFGVYGQDVDGELERAASIMEEIWGKIIG